MGVKVMAVSSSGGHWVQLRRLRPAFTEHQTIFVSTDKSLKNSVDAEYHAVRDANMWDKLGLMILCCQVMWLVIKIRPAIVISTGAAAGFFALFFGKLIGAKTIWVDSIANSERMSLAGKRVRPFADVWLTQWEEVSGPEGPYFKGQVI